MNLEHLAREYLSYDKDTGVFTWVKSRGTQRAGNVAGHLNTQGYRVINIGRRLVPEHRLAWFFIHSKWPKCHIDHINGNASDNRIINLRECTHTQNQWNAKPRKNKSGFKGVSQHSYGWQARIRVNKEIVHLGTFENAVDAARRYERAAKLIAGEFAYCNRDSVSAIRAMIKEGE